MTDQLTANKPLQIKTATSFLWTVLGMGVLITLLDFRYLTAISSVSFIVLITLFSSFVMGLLTYKISIGRNWARIVFLVMFVIGAFSYLKALSAMFERSVVIGILSLAQLIMQLYALYLIFTNPGSSWFRKNKA